MGRCITFLRTTTAVTGVVFLLLAGVSVQQACLSQSGFTIVSDIDGPGPSPYPPGNCEWTLKCPLESNVQVTNLEGRNTPAGANNYFTLRLIPRMYGMDFLVNHLAPYSNDFGPISVPFQTNEIVVRFRNMNPALTGVGGFTLTYSCVSQCSAFTAGASALDVAAPARSGQLTGSYTAGASSEICTWRLQRPPCQPWEYISFTMIDYPQYSNGGTTQPNWKFVVGKRPVIYADDFSAIEHFYEPEVTNFTVRALPNTVVQFQVNYYCTPVANCTFNETRTMDYPYAAILSDHDGQGPFEYGQGGPLLCQYNVVCPYDSNIQLRYLNGEMRSGTDTLSIQTAFGRGPTVYPRPPGDIIGPVTAQYLYNQQTLTFETRRANTDCGTPPSAGCENYPGFTQKYECEASCSVASPQSVVLGASGSFSQAPFAASATAGLTSMCRWEATQATCGALGSMILVNVLRAAPNPPANAMWRFVVDYASSEFLYIYPAPANRYPAASATTPTKLFLPITGFNMSVRSFSAVNGDPPFLASFGVDWSCANVSVCGSGLASPAVLTWASGYLLSDADGRGPAPYAAGAGCVWSVRCPGGGTPSFFSMEGQTVASVDVLDIAGTAFSGLFDGRTATPTGSVVAVSFSRVDAASTAQPLDGFTVQYRCGPGTPEPPTPAPTPVPPTPTPRPETTAPTPAPCAVQPNCTGNNCSSCFVAPAAAAAEDNGKMGAIIGGVLGGLIGLLLLCFLLLVVARRRAGYKSVHDMFFSDSSRWTKGFNPQEQQKEELARIGADRNVNERNNVDDMVTELLTLHTAQSTSRAPVAAAAAEPADQWDASAWTTPAAVPTRVPVRADSLAVMAPPVRAHAAAHVTFEGIDDDI